MKISDLFCSTTFLVNKISFTHQNNTVLKHLTKLATFKVLS